MVMWLIKERRKTYTAVRCGDLKKPIQGPRHEGIIILK
jgi:hypothetical protein